MTLKRSNHLDQTPLRGAVAVLGGLGFIGNALVSRLSSGGGPEVIRVMDRDTADFEVGEANGIELHRADVRDRTEVERAVRGCNVVFNLVGQGGHLESMRDPRQDLESNISAQLSILEACKSAAPRAHLIFASTRQVYGTPASLPVSEYQQANPVDINGIHKLTAERYHLLYSRLGAVQSTVLRLTNTYGPGMRTSGPNCTFLGAWIHNLVEGDPILVFGDGLGIRDLMHVDDVVDAFTYAANHRIQTVDEIFNIGSDSPVTLIEIARHLTSVSNAHSRVECVPFPDLLERIDIGSYVSDSKKFRCRTGWQPKTILSEGLQATLESFGLVQKLAR
jgi:UDP-glucose 4-epimerase